MILPVAFTVVGGLFLASAAASLFHLRWVRRLPQAVELPAFSEARPMCSVVIAARNEEHRIEATLRHLLEQSGVPIEIIVADDRSSDGTAKILTQLAAEDSRVQTLRIDHLPEHWLGKCYACHLAAGMARGEWLLFTDADCWLKPDVIARALAVAQRDTADHIALTPGITPRTFAAHAWYLMFLTSFLSWIAGVNRDKRGAHFGLGAFNLVRALAYRECGGHEALRLTVLDDIRLGLLLNRCGKRTRAFLGANDVECHWGTTLHELMRVMEKNYFAALDYRVEVVVAGGFMVTLMLIVIVVGLIGGTPLGLFAAFSSLALILPAIVIARRMSWPVRCALGVPAMFPVFLYAMLRSAFITLRHGGIRWRDTFYPLSELRARNVRGR
jgi:glycosyltransferase involved in cell wall biosynthesis